jgi:hypothetical protein
MKQIKYITCIHGNETTPKTALDTLGVQYILANKLATQYGVRYVEKDLNSSFGSSGNSYEEKIGRKLLTMIPEKSIVVDLHTMPVISEPFVIVTDPTMIPFAKTTGLRHIVYMKYSTKKGFALINHRKGISIETGVHGSIEALRITKMIVENISQGRSYDAVVYEVYDQIKKFTVQQNFKLFAQDDESYYPVLAGIRTYDFLGLKARIHEEKI